VELEPEELEPEELAPVVPAPTAPLAALLGPDEPFFDDPLLSEEPAPLSDPDLLPAESDELPLSDDDPDDSDDPSEPLLPLPAVAPTLPLRLSVR
jgi:hypothetical protein